MSNALLPTLGASLTCHPVEMEPAEPPAGRRSESEPPDEATSDAFAKIGT